MNGNLKHDLLKFIFIITLALMIKATGLYGQSGVSDLPVEAFFTSQTQNTEGIIYLSGDGGMNRFSTTLCKTFESLGYPVIAVNSRSYFWKQKSPQKFVDDLSALMKKYEKLWHKSSFIVVGYSFGADVGAFVPGLLPTDVKQILRSVVLMNPGLSTDFEIRLSGMLGFEDDNGKYDIISEINKISETKMMCLFSEDDKITHTKIINRRVQIDVIPGNHQFDNDVQLIVSTIKKWF